jgi:hypothetical protein
MHDVNMSSFSKGSKMTLLSLTGLTLSPSASFAQSCNMCKVPLKFAGLLCKNQIRTVPEQRYSIS